MRKRFSVRSPGLVTGFAVALPGDTTKDGGPVWYGGGKLAADLSWPKLQQRWIPARAAPGRPHLTLTAEERNAVWDHATRAAADATAQIRNLAWTDPAAAADAAWATSDTLHVAAAALGSRILRQAADAYDRAARPPYGRIPPPTPAGNQLRQAARLLSAFAYLTGDRSMTPIVLITRLAALAEAVAELRHAQQHAAQAAAARAAAERLYAAARPAPPAQPRPAQHASTAAQLAGQSFPRQPGQQQDGPVRPRADLQHCDGRHHPGHVALPGDAAGTAQHQICGFQRTNATGRPGGTLRHPVSAACRMPCHCGVSVRHAAAGKPGVTDASWRMATSSSCHLR